MLTRRRNATWWCWSGARSSPFLAKHPDAWAELITVLCGRMRTVDHQMAELAMASLPARLAKALLRLAVPETRATDGGASDCIHLTQRELGNVIGATRESVNKHLRAWQRKGWVRIADQLVVITDRAGLEVLSEPEG
jgi:CRP/FNR family cyclic AMP-dependent transcriptional regulator